MKKLYEGPSIDIMWVSGDIVKTSFGGWQEGDNDITWGNPWSEGV